MKKIFLLSTVLAFAFAGCQDVNDKFDSWLPDATKPTNVINDSIEISESNIATIVSATKGTDDEAYGSQLQKDKVFSENAPASILIPYLLPKLYYSADVASTINATYQFKENRDEDLVGLSTSTANPAFVLGDSEYKTVWGEPYATALTPKKSPSVELPKLLAANFPDAEAGTYKIIEYAYSEEEPIVTNDVVLYSEDFNDLGLEANEPVAINGWLNVDLEGTRSWQVKSFSNNSYVQASSNGSKGKNDNWLIMKPVSLAGIDKPFFIFDIKVGYYTSSCLDILVSTDFDGKQANIKTATWTNITSEFDIPTQPTTGYGAGFESAGKGNLAAFAGKTVYIAFRYKGDDTSSPKATTTYQLDNVKVADEKKGREVKSKNTVYAAYQNVNGTWKSVSSNVIVLQPQDYTVLGKTYITVAEAPKYLPAILLHNNVLQVEGSEKTVVYMTGKNSFYADKVTYHVDGGWTINSQVVTRTDQFILSSKGWIFDPTIVINPMTSADYMLVVNYVELNLAPQTPSLLNSAKNTEFYYGFNSNYKNITFRESDRKNDPSYPINGTDAEKLAFCKQRAIEGLELFLELKYPDAQPLVAGIEQNAALTVTIYYGPRSSDVENFVYEFQCVGTKEWKFLQRTSELDHKVEKAD